MPKSKKEKVAKKQKDIHPNSRKAGQLVRQEHHNERIEKRKTERESLQAAKCQKIAWFQENLQESTDKLSQDEMSELIESYLGRFDEELEILKEDNSTARHKNQSSQNRREEKLKTVLDHERHLFEVGAFEAPDMTCAKTVKILREWDGKKEMLPNIKIKKFKRVR